MRVGLVLQEIAVDTAFRAHGYPIRKLDGCGPYVAVEMVLYDI